MLPYVDEKGSCQNKYTIIYKGQPLSFKSSFSCSFYVIDHTPLQTIFRYIFFLNQVYLQDSGGHMSMVVRVGKFAHPVFS